jgi:hypothetical protein
MQFVIMEYISKSVRDKAIYGAVDKKSPGNLPAIDDYGRWAECQVIEEDQLGFAGDAKTAIGSYGYYLFSDGWGAGYRDLV